MTRLLSGIEPWTSLTRSELESVPGTNRYKSFEDKKNILFNDTTVDLMGIELTTDRLLVRRSTHYVMTPLNTEDVLC